MPDADEASALLMSKNQNQSTQNAWADRIRALKNVPPVLKILWESGPQVVAWGLILRVLVAPTPWAIAKVAAWIINGVNHVLQHQSLPPHFWWVVGLDSNLSGQRLKEQQSIIAARQSGRM